MKKVVLLVGLGLLGCGSSSSDDTTDPGAAGSSGSVAQGGASGTSGQGGAGATAGASGGAGKPAGGSGAGSGQGGAGQAGAGQSQGGAGQAQGGAGTGQGGAGTSAGGAGNGQGGAGNGQGGTAQGGAGSGGAACTGAPSTAGVECTYSYSGLNTSPSVNLQSTVAWSCSDTTRSLTGNGIPDHEVGTFPNPNCPNTIAEHAVAASMTLTPVSTGKAAKIGVVGYSFNGVKFDPSTAGTCTVAGATTSCSLIGNTGSWNIEALGQSSFNFGVDDNNAHVQPTGEYHYHGMPEGVLSKLGQGMAPTLVGFALDGFPIYARYGYSDPNDSASAVKAVKGSFQLKATPDADRPSTDTYPMGAFTQDYEYVAGSGDLDECNGRTGVTPEFPCGIYHYYITDTYPFIQRCVKGTPTGGGMGMGMGGGPGMGGMGGGPGMGMGGGPGMGGMGGGPGMGGMGGPPACQPGQTMMCCGDGVCGGPETHGNCPADCP